MHLIGPHIWEMCVRYVQICTEIKNAFLENEIQLSARSAIVQA